LRFSATFARSPSVVLGSNMTATESAAPQFSAATNWRTPLVIVVCGCLIGLLTFGPR